MPHRVAGVLVNPRVETGVMIVTDLFPLAHTGRPTIFIDGSDGMGMCHGLD